MQMTDIGKKMELTENILCKAIVTRHLYHKWRCDFGLYNSGDTMLNHTQVVYKG